ALRGGWLYTGDTGYLDEDGYLFIVDRKKDLIISSGFNVYPRNVEDAIYEHDAVEEVTVIGIKDDYKGEVPKAFVKLREGAALTVDDLKASLKDKLAKYEIPAEVEFRAELPKTPVGKLSKKELVAEEAAKREAAKAKTG
ncbi:MAG: AMP-binding protein, partial [Alphaproteobacteria bacterium]|nr:AMP-binding protein [Alphaproteobacteria bacterium]